MEVDGTSGGNALAPLRHIAFRRIWTASLFSYFGLLINGVGAGWAMTQLSDRPEWVALVQTALMLPFMLFSLPAGAISDTYDRRLVGITMIGMAFVFATTLVLATFLGWLTPQSLLLFCFLLGTANAMFGPNLQASVSEQVPLSELPAGVALNAISFNLARSFGPALGGLLVALWGPLAAFAANAVSYMPMLAALALWNRVKTIPRLPPEHIGTAIVSGIRYIANSPPVRGVVFRAALFGISGAAITALMPLVARDVLSGGPATYGVLLGAFGVGAVLGGLLLQWLRNNLSSELLVSGSTATTGLMILVLAHSKFEILSVAALMIAGIGWMQALTMLIVSVQIRAPRWVTGRAIATFQAALAGGIATGSWIWGMVAQSYDTQTAVALSGGALIACAFVGRWFPVPPTAEATDDIAANLDDPEVTLALSGRSGPIAVEIDYVVDPDKARKFYDAMLEVRRIRRRIGAYDWSLSRDIAAPERWTEAMHYPTWHDYLRRRARMSAAELEVVEGVTSDGYGAKRVTVRRMLERPFGSVRWRADTPDPGVDLPVGPGTGTT